MPTPPHLVHLVLHSLEVLHKVTRLLLLRRQLTLQLLLPRL
jgi:hypothetical protein